MRNTILSVVLSATALFGGFIMAHAENKVELASIFQSGGVLQQQKLIPVWGWGTPNSIVTGELNGVKVRSVSNDHGYFLCGRNYGRYFTPVISNLLNNHER